MAIRLPLLSGDRSSHPVEDKLPGIRHVVAVASGKGGVGKSTVTAHLALALKEAGQRVGVVDADILGPSIPAMLGAPYGVEPRTQDQKLIPEERHGVKLVSMGMLTNHDAPAILRGPMVTKYIRLFVSDVVWGRLDYLLVDLPPGTGDIQLTLAQSVPLSGTVVVTTPQDISLNIARRGLRMFQKVRVPILGVVENMSSFECPSCGHVTSIFGHGGGERMSRDLGVPFLGELPIDATVVEEGDRGVPALVERPESATARGYRDLARTITNALETGDESHLKPFTWDWDRDTGAPAWNERATKKKGRANHPLGLRRRDERTLSILWEDGMQYEYDVRDLRLLCPCAQCVDEMTGERVLKPESVPMDVAPIRISNVGLYAVSFHWTDGHSTGIYSFDYLRRIGESTAGSMEV